MSEPVTPSSPPKAETTATRRTDVELNDLQKVAVDEFIKGRIQAQMEDDRRAGVVNGIAAHQKEFDANLYNSIVEDKLLLEGITHNFLDKEKQKTRLPYEEFVSPIPSVPFFVPPGKGTIKI